MIVMSAGRMCIFPHIFTDATSGTLFPSRYPLQMEHSPNFYNLFAELERNLAIQLDRIRESLTPKGHAPGARKPDLETTEAKLMGIEEDE